MSAAVRRARAEDIPRLEALITAESLPAYGLDEYLETFFVLEEDQRVVGCAGLELYGEAALLRSVVVEPGRRGQADGRRLVEAARKEALRRGVRRLYLFTLSAGGFFGRMGFRKVELDDFEEAVRASRQYAAVSSMPGLRWLLTAMARDLS